MVSNIYLRFIFLLTLVSSTAAHAIQNTDFLANEDHNFWYDIHTLPTITLDFSEEQWARLNTSTQNNREEVTAQFTYRLNNQDHNLKSIGVKLSGNTSFTLPETETGHYIQANFTLDFDEFVDDQSLRGISALKLKRFKDDSTFVHEPLSNQIMHNFNLWTAHSSSYTRLVLKIGDREHAYFGIYRMNESVNRYEYLDKRFGSNNNGGFLWQGNYKDWGIAHFSRITENWGGVGDFDQASFEYKSKGKYFSEAHAQLVEIATNFTQLKGESFNTYIKQHLNIELFLKTLASEAVLGHWDGFWGNGNNFMFYIDEASMLHFIPFDTDNTLGTSLFVEDVGERDPLNFGLSQNTPLLVTKVLAIEEYKKQYLLYIEQLVNQQNLAQQTYASSWISKVHSLIKNDLKNDTNDNETIIDQPATWGNQPDYRLFALDTGKPWFDTKKAAVQKAVNDANHIYETMFYRGTTNNWGSNAMELTADNLWTIQINLHAENAGNNPRFKFDVNGDWQNNFGDNNADGVVEANGADIPFSQGYGLYNILFDTQIQRYQVIKLTPPVAHAGIDTTITAGSTVTFDGSASTDADGTITHFSWSNGLAGITAEKSYPTPGEYTITLTVTDNDNLNAKDTVKITVVANAVDEENPNSGGSGTISLGLLMLITLALLNKFTKFRPNEPYNILN